MAIKTIQVSKSMNGREIKTLKGWKMKVKDRKRKNEKIQREKGGRKKWRRGKRRSWILPFSLPLILSPDTRVDCSKLDFNYSREMTPDPLGSGHIWEEERGGEGGEKRMTAEGRKESETKGRENDVGEVTNRGLRGGEQTKKEWGQDLDDRWRRRREDEREEAREEGGGGKNEVNTVWALCAKQLLTSPVCVCVCVCVWLMLQQSAVVSIKAQPLGFTWCQYHRRPSPSRPAASLSPHSNNLHPRTPFFLSFVLFFKFLIQRTLNSPVMGFAFHFIVSLSFSHCSLTFFCQKVLNIQRLKSNI